MKKGKTFVFAVAVMSCISLYSMKETKLVVAPGKSKEATQKMHNCLFDSYLNTECQGENLYNKFEQFLKEGADPNAEYSEGYSILKRLSLYGNMRPDDEDHKKVPSSLIPLLVQYGAAIDTVSGEEKTNALYVATRHGVYSNYEKAEMLLQCGADVNCKNRKGGTPLHMRKYLRDEKFLKLLLIYGADPLIKDQKGQDAFEYDPIIESDATQRRQQRMALHQQAQKLLAYKARKEKEGIATVEIEEVFGLADFPYPHRKTIEPIVVQIKEQN